MNNLNLESIWSALLLLTFFFIYNKILKNTAFSKIGKALSLLLFIGCILLPDFFGVKNEYLYRLLQSISVIFALNLFNKESRR
ncbi:hypothetical protein [Caldisalinibacter kiritimatiensis]|uniref:hypothetical protein n=1 Tax=Caldisalinibacter kiritimatiensis TaxID=1304284 RepID=UPI0004B5BA27|nr:hypothetical protein [Caldisalinibacter kiritimatiensis]